MERLKQVAILNRVMHELRKRDNWCGETSVQKTIYLLQEVAGVPLGFDFILYKHGPFSFELRDELTAERGDGLVALETEPGYGPRFMPTDLGDNLALKYPRTLREYECKIDFVANWVDDKGVSELEQLATALWISRQYPDMAVDDRAGELHKLKPHIPVFMARIAVTEADALLESAAELRG